MKLEPTNNQYQLLKFIEDAGGKTSVESWMNSATIASLIGRRAIKAEVLKRSVRLVLQPQGFFMLDFKPAGRQGYYSNLHEVSVWRHR